jgi:hypothetical protein
MAAVAGESQGEERHFAGLGHNRRIGQIGGPTAEIPQIFSQDMGQEAPTPDRLARGLGEHGDKTQVGMPARKALPRIEWMRRRAASICRSCNEFFQIRRSETRLADTAGRARPGSMSFKRTFN